MKSNVNVSVWIAKTLNAAAAASGLETRYDYVTMDESNYAIYVHYMPDIYSNNDRIGKNKYRAICVSYPYNYYAVGTYLTTNDLKRLYNESDGTINDFINNVLLETEI